MPRVLWKIRIERIEEEDEDAVDNGGSRIAETHALSDLELRFARDKAAERIIAETAIKLFDNVLSTACK